MSSCVAFLANTDATRDDVVTFNGNSYHLPAWSVSILPDCKTVIFNSAQVLSFPTIGISALFDKGYTLSIWFHVSEFIIFTGVRRMSRYSLEDVSNDLGQENVS